MSGNNRLQMEFNVVRLTLLLKIFKLHLIFLKKNISSICFDDLSSKSFKYHYVNFHYILLFVINKSIWFLRCQKSLTRDVIKF